MAPVLLVVVGSSTAAWVDVPAGSRVQVVQVACGARRPATTSMAVRCVGGGGGETGPVLSKASDDDDDDRKLIKIVIRLGEMTARLLERVHARPGCTDSDKLEMSLQLTSLREQCARLLEAVEAGEIAGHAAARLLGSYHSKLRVLLAVHGGGHLDAAAAPPLAVPPPGGQIDPRLLAKFGIYAFELPTNWVDRSLIASMMLTLDCAMDEAKDFMNVTDEQDDGKA